MLTSANKRAEARCRYYVREEAKRLGWDVRHPNAGGYFLEEQEIVDFFPLLRKSLGSERPDFGTMDRQRRLRAVIECKNDVDLLGRAIDEAKGYANQINESDDFDVKVAIGVAGTPDRFVQTRGFFSKGSTWIDLASHGFPLTQLPTLDELETAITNADGTTDVHFPHESEFAEAAVQINNILRLAKIEESLRPRVVGAIILALYHGEFSYDSATVIDHINANISAAAERFDGLDFDRRKLLIGTLSLSAESHRVRDKIDLIVHQLERLNVRSIVKSGVDFLGKFYEAFLRYGSDAKKMGIVFTPRHITKFCAELADVRLDHTVYDPAAGTGGFLVAAFDKMMVEAKGSPIACEKVKNSIYGCDTNPTVWALSVLNMFFRGDGKSNILYKNCFENAENFAGKFNRVLLNPPFSQEGEPETDFINHALSSLMPGGRLAVVVKTSVLVDEGLAAWRQSLIERHHVMGVITLPMDLFYPTSVPTVIMLVKAHTPTIEAGTLLARIENDGYEISKKRRIERDGSQLPEIASMFGQHLERGTIETVPNVACSVPQSALRTGAEICAERWLPSGAYGLDEFEVRRSDSMRQVSLAIANYPDITDEIIEDYEDQLRSHPTRVRPTQRATLSDWFDVANGASDGSKNYPEGSIPYISSGDSYNSIVAFVQPPASEVFESPCVSVTGFGHACIQPWRFCARGNGGSAVRVLHAKFNLTLAELFWFIGQINFQRWRFHYGRMATVSRLSRLEIDPPPNDLPEITDLARRLKSFRSGLAILSETTGAGNGVATATRFRMLADEWKATRGSHSRIVQMTMQPAYQQIIGMGKEAIPFLLAEMEKDPSHWSWALRSITGVDPVPDASRGKLLETALAWLRWGQQQGYKW